MIAAIGSGPVSIGNPATQASTPGVGTPPAGDMQAPPHGPASAAPKPTAELVRSGRAAEQGADALESELAAANQKLAGDGRQLRFDYDRDAAQLVVRLVDTGTQKVLSQYPSDQALRAVRMALAGKPLVHMQA